jgi:hypothetical protein
MPAAPEGSTCLHWLPVNDPVIITGCRQVLAAGLKPPAHKRVPTHESLMVVTLLLSGVQLIILGVLGEYLGRLFLTINDKPQFVIRDITRNDFAWKPPINSGATESLVRSNL